MNRLIRGDCLEVMDELIKEGTKVDLVLTDPPYGKMVDYSKTSGRYKKDEFIWDKVIPIDKMFDKIVNILRPNGRCVLFSQEPFTSNLILSTVPSLPFRYKAVWEKSIAGNSLGSNKNMLNYIEDINMFQKVFFKEDFENTNPVRAYLQEEYNKCSNINFKKLLGNSMASHYFTKTEEFRFPTKENYEKLQTTGNFNKPYEELKSQNDNWKKQHLEKLNDKYPSVFNLWEGNKSKSNILKYKRDSTHYHPTQKPVLLLEDLIKTYTNEGDTVLDFTMGSGSTGVACVNTNRNFIGIELEKEYYDIAVDRCNKAIEEKENGSN